MHQGDSLSPFLFILAMEGLNVGMKKKCDKGTFDDIQLHNNGPMISHLFYVDEVLFIDEWYKRNIKILARILWFFHASSGLKVNIQSLKSSVLELHHMKSQDGPIFLVVSLHPSFSVI